MNAVPRDEWKMREHQWREQCQDMDRRAREAMKGISFGRKVNKYAGISRDELRDRMRKSLEDRRKKEPSQEEREAQLRIAAHYFMFGLVVGLKPKAEHKQRRPAPSIVMRHIMREVACKHGVSIDELKGSRRSSYIVEARKEFYYRACVETTAALPHIGKFCGGRDHTTILHGAISYADANGLPRHNQPGVKAT